MPTVGELMDRFGSDKNGPGRHGHSYGPVYDELFAVYKGTAKRVLEIGVLGGASLYAWREFFVAADVVGLDNNAPPVVGHRIRTVTADSTDAKAVAAAFADAGIDPAFDVIVDDGGHWLHEQTATFAVMRPFLRPGGIYVIEDVQDVVGATPELGALGFEMIDLRPNKSRGDDVLAVLRG